MNFLTLECNLEKLTTFAIWGVYIICGLIILSIIIGIVMLIYFIKYRKKLNNKTKELNSRKLPVSKWEEKILAMEKEQEKIRNRKL